MSNGKLLWVDDEIDLLKGHIIFLEKKGYNVTTMSNGIDAVELCREETFDLILLDEMMPGLTGLENKGHSACNTDSDGYEKRGRRHHEPSYRA